MTSSAVSMTSADVRPIRRWLQINVCVLCCLAGIAFSAAEGSPLGLITIPVAVIGLLFIDRRDVFGLSPWVANLLGFGAFIAAGLEFFGESIEGRLLGFGHLLVYLSWVLLLQRKGNPQFWWLCALSVLQVATASVLTNDLWFPLIAVLFMILALWTLSVFSLDRAVSRSAGVERTARQFGGRLAAAASESADESRSRSNIQTESAARWFTPRFLGGVLINGLLSLLLGLSIFILTPRIWAGSFQLFRDADTLAAQPVTGFAEEVSLGDMGDILENPDLVLEVAFFNNATDEPLDVEQTVFGWGHDAPLFRGKVLSRYSQGHWSTSRLIAPTSDFRNPRSRNLVRQEIILQPIGTYTLFTAGRAIGCRSETRVAINHEQFNNMFSVESNSTSRRALARPFQYEAFSLPSGESFEWNRGFRNAMLRKNYEFNLLAIPSGLERLQQLTARILEESGDSERSPAETASILVNHLRNTGEYSYSLSAAIEDPSIDPVEDFLFNRKEGHCEYYASALALMLRSAGIPARLISGFKGGALNPVTGKYEVRQLHAHAWVEGLIDDRWVVLDATPAARDASVANISTTLSPWTRLTRFFQSWWSQGLIMNQSQQRRIIYEPLQELFEGGLSSVRRVGLFQAILGWLRELSANPEEWISVRGFVTAFVLLLLLSGVVWACRRLWRLLSGWSLEGSRRQRRQRKSVAFYERFRAILAREGFQRTETTTHQEFAADIQRHWRERSEVDGLADLPHQLTSAFYRVRFGDHVFSEAELQSIDRSLTRLESWLQERPTPVNS